MHSQGKHSTALVSIYDAANDSTEWNNSLDACVEYVQAHSANIMFQENEKDSQWKYALGSQRWRACSAEQMNRSIMMFEKYDTEAWEFVQRHRKHTLLVDTDYWRNGDELNKREDYRFYRELGFTRKVGCKLNDNLCWTDNFAFQFPSRLQQVPGESMQKIQRLLPHVAKSIELWRTFSILKSQYKAVLTALDHVEIGLCIARPDGSIIVTNEAADRILTVGAAIRLGKDNLFHCREKSIEGSIRQSIQRSCATSSGKASIAEAFQLVECDSGTQVAIEIAPLRDAAGEIENHFSGALVTLIDLSADLKNDCRKLARAYKLSKAEQDVCQLLTTGISVSEIAESRNVNPETVKSQLKSIYRKTNCKSRVGLMRMALRANPPVK